jgi:putative two-component system response regulator
MLLVAETEREVCKVIRQAAAGLLPVLCVHDAEAACERAFATPKLQIALIDMRFRGGGLMLANEISLLSPDTHILLFDENPTVEELEEAVNSHVAGFMRLPLDPDSVRSRISHLLQAPPRSRGLGDMISNLHTEVRTRNELLVRARRAGLIALARLAEYRDTETGMHVERVAAFSEVLSLQLQQGGVYADQISKPFLQSMRLAAAVHDIGKVAIPDSILHKPGRLTPAEFEVVKSHTIKGWEVIEAGRKADGGTDYEMGLAAQVIRSHHEKYDGSGYPDGLKGEAIPLAGRIVAVIDAYDAMRSHRVYNPERARDDTAEEIRRCMGSHFDPKIAEVFLRHIDVFEMLGKSIERVTARWK